MIKKLLCVVSVLLCFSFFSNSISSEEANSVFSKGSAAEKKIALTFDDGPHPRYTKKILSILEKYNIKATFFVIGVNIQNYPQELKKIYESGHEIGNHSYDHHSTLGLNKEELCKEIETCEELIYNSIGTKPTLFRPPQGKFDEMLTQITAKKGYSVILWSIDTRDWEHASPSNIAETVIKNISGGDIILMHDYVSGKNTTCDALEIIIPALQEKGYEFVTVSELLKR